MTTSDRPAMRILPLDESEYTDDVREALSAGTPDGKPREAEFFRVLARHPKLYRRWASWATYPIARGELPPRLRELVILRNAWVCQAEIEWAEHVEIARRGELLTSGEIAALVEGPAAPVWSALDRAVIDAVDELLDGAELTEPTWQVLDGELTAPQIIELFMVLGNYAMLAWIQKSLRIPLRAGLDGLDAR